MTGGHEYRERVGLVSRWSAPLYRPSVRPGIRVLGMKNMISRELVGQNRFAWTPFVKSSNGSVGWMNILAGNKDENLGSFRLFFLRVVRTCPLLGENWRVNWRNGGVGRLLRKREEFLP